MPKYHNRFTGHLPPGDPRNLTTGAGGCVWPTIPPYRVLLYSDDATGEWSFLRSHPVLMEQDRFVSHHNHTTWRAIEKPHQIYHILLEKIYIRDQFPNYRYWLTILLAAWSSERVFVKNLTGSCNRSVYWGPLYRTVQMGTTGKDFRQHQVVFDATRPPRWLGP